MDSSAVCFLKLVYKLSENKQKCPSQFLSAQKTPKYKENQKIFPFEKLEPVNERKHFLGLNQHLRPMKAQRPYHL